jgi:hypothetical protein
VTLGTQNKKKVSFLAVLGLGCAYSVYTNLIEGPSGAPAPSAPAPARQAAADLPGVETPAAGPAGRRGAPGVGRARSEEFHPVLRSKRPEERIDTTTVDPTLRLDLLAKVQAEDRIGGERNLFQFWEPPGPKAKEPVVVPAPVAPVLVSNEQPKPPAPIGLKYCGYSTERRNGTKTAFFLDGEEILIASEGGIVKRRYRVVRIGANSVLVEDTESKHQQPLPLAMDTGG